MSIDARFQSGTMKADVSLTSCFRCDVAPVLDTQHIDAVISNNFKTSCAIGNRKDLMPKRHSNFVVMLPAKYTRLRILGDLQALEMGDLALMKMADFYYI